MKTMKLNRNIKPPHDSLRDVNSKIRAYFPLRRPKIKQAMMYGFLTSFLTCLIMHHFSDSTVDVTMKAVIGSFVLTTFAIYIPSLIILHIASSFGPKWMTEQKALDELMESIRDRGRWG